MSKLVSGLDAVYRRKTSSWQDTTVPPNVLLHLFGPEEASQTLVPYLDIANQAYHRDSMKGQTADIPNLQFLFKVPNTITLNALDLTANQAGHKESMRGQVADPQNFLLSSAIFNPAVGQPGSFVINPVFNKHHIQDTAISRNPVLDLSTVALPLPLFSQTEFEAEQIYHRDTLIGQYGRSGAIIPLGVPPAKNEIYTFVPKAKTAQEPFVFPNALLFGISATQLPFVYRQSEDHQWRRPKTQEPYSLPNVLAITKPVTAPFVRRQFEDLQWKAHAAQEPFLLQNQLVRILPPSIIQPFVQQQFDHLQFKTHPTQPHFDYPNLLILQIIPNPPQVQVPYVLALTANQAIQVLNFYGFFNVQVAFGYSTVNPPGIVFAQNPQPYAFYTLAGLVTITVSLGQFVPGSPPVPPLKVTQRNFSLEEMAAREWGPSFRAPDHRIYVFSNARAFDSTDLGDTGIYEKGIDDPVVKKPPFPN
jgi:hypothetical protein